MLRTLQFSDLSSKVVDIISEVKILTGAILYTGNELRLQVDVITRFFMSNMAFATLTTNEILHAFYLNNAGEYDQVYRHYNRELNAEFIGDVLLAYIKYKRRLYERVDIKALIDPPKETPVVLMPSEEEYRQFILQDLNFYKNGDTDFIFCTPAKYKLLRQLGYIEIYSRHYWNKAYYMSMGERIRFSESPLIRLSRQERDRVLKLRDLYAEWKKTGVIPVSEHRILVHNTRRNLYLWMLGCLSACGINNIFSEVKGIPYDKRTNRRI